MIQQRIRSAVAGVAVAGLVVAACGSPNPSSNAPLTSAPSVAGSGAAPTSFAPSPSNAATATAVPSTAGNLPTTGRIVVADKFYAITLPEAWTRLELGADGLDDLIKAGASSLPAEMQDLLGSQVAQMAASGVSLFAFRRPEGTFAAGTTLNILSLPGLGVPLDTFESLIVGQLKSVIGQDAEITTARVQGPAGEFLRLTYDLKTGTVSIGTVQYLFLSPTQQFFISCGTPAPIVTIQAECESIATTLEILN